MKKEERERKLREESEVKRRMLEERERKLREKSEVRSGMRKEESEGSLEDEIKLKREEKEEERKLKDKKLEAVRNLLFGAMMMEKVLSMCVECSQGIVWDNKVAWNCWRMPGTPAWDTESV